MPVLPWKHLYIASLITLCSAAVLPGQTQGWTLRTNSVSGLLRSRHAIAYDAARNQTVMFGGLDDSSNLLFNDTWVWDGTAWTRKNPSVNPPARYGHAMAYDAARRQVVMFGGAIFLSDGTSIFLNDTWVWDGLTWTRKESQSGPSPRDGAAMVYDPVRAEIVLFGGATQSTGLCSGLSDETWVWDGSSWIKRTAATSPPPRSQAALAFDSARNQTVMFGGATVQCFNQPPTVSSDTWTWDGLTWTQRKPANNPQSRYRHAMAYDSAGGQTILFGGAIGGSILTSLGDTWAWDGTNWVLKSSSNPPARLDHAMTYDNMRAQVVMFAGRTTSAVFPNLSDTWTWSSVGSTTPFIGNVISAGAFGAFLAAAPGSWIEIYGGNLSGSTRSWLAADFVGGNAPTSLDGVQVTIGGQKAFVDYVNPNQVNAQIPSNVAPGPQAVTVSNGSLTSTPVNLTINSLQPGLLAPPSFLVGGKQYVVAQFLDGTYVLPTGLIAGVNSRPAQAGETIVIYGTGFGPVLPDTPAGQIVTQNNQLVNPITLKFGLTTASLSYAGLVPQYVGLYQFNVVVPAVPANDAVPLSLAQNGTPGIQTLYIAVK